MKQSPSWEGTCNNRWDCQEIPRISSNPQVQYRIQKNPQIVRILSKMNLLHILMPHPLRCIFKVILPFTPISQVSRQKFGKYSYLNFLIRKSAFLNLGATESFLPGPLNLLMDWLRYIHV
jgi:hypothetical protein